MKDFDRTALSGIVQAADSSENTRHEALLEERLADAGIPMDFTNLSQVKGTVSYDLMIPEKGFTSKKKRGNNACNRGRHGPLVWPRNRHNQQQQTRPTP